jgi:hypothetical protein
MANSVNYTYVYFSIKDYTGVESLSSYSLPNTPLYFAPDFTSSSTLTATNNISNTLVRWDFGDGSFSNSLTAEHLYSWPGKYNVRLTIYDKFGNAYDSSYRPTVIINDFIKDQILFEDEIKFIYDIPASKISDPLIVNRHNSWQSYHALSAEGYTISLYASGALGDYQNSEDFYNNKWSHLSKLSRFYAQVSVGDTYEYAIVDKIKTSNTEIYANIVNNKIQYCSKDDQGSVFVGTTGTCSFYYVDDQVKNFTSREPPIFIFATLDAAKFNDRYSQFKNSYEFLSYPPYSFQNIKPAVLPVIKIRHNSAAKLSISTTGIDGEGTLSTTKFDIPVISWQNTEIPFVIKFKDQENFTTKTYPSLSSSTTNPTISALSSFNVTLGLLQKTETGTREISSIKFYEDFEANAPQSIGAFYKGYFTIPNETLNCYLTASVVVEDPKFYPKDTLFGWIALPQYNTLLRFFRQEIYDFCSGLLSISISASETFFDANNNRNVYAIQIAPSGSGPGNDYQTWFADGSRDTLFKFDVRGQIISSFPMSAYPIINNNIPGVVNLLSPTLSSAAPGSLSLDGNCDVWVALFDSVSCIKIDAKDGHIKAVAYPDFINESYYQSSDYNIPHLKGFAGENSLLPSSIDTDIYDNIWVTYNHPVSNFLIKYDTNGVLLTTIPFSPLVAPQEAVVDRDKFVWVTAFNYNNTAGITSLTGKNDLLYKFTSEGALVSGYPLSGFRLIGDITVDSLQNAWVVQDRDTLTRVSGIDASLTNYIGGSGNLTNYICSIGGIACDSSDFIWVINAVNNKMYFINTYLPPVSSLYEYNRLELTYPSAPLSELSTFEDKTFQAYGDWLGGRWINKHLAPLTITRTITGQSNTFNIYPLSGQYNISKINEDFDAEQFYKSLIFTESLEEKKIFFNDFLGTIVGGISAQPYELGKTVYEKIANFTNNITDVDKVNLDQLLSLCEELSVQFEQYNYPFPPQVLRLVNILSIKHKNLWGERNKFTQSFYKNAYTANNNLPLNFGTEYSTLTSIISSGIPIVSYEVFSNTYMLINSMVIPGTVFGKAVPLSSYTYDWGWGLIAPRSLTGSRISDYYKFYEFIPAYENSHYNNIIDWVNPMTTLNYTNSSFNDWSKDNGIMQNILSYELTKGLRLFLSGSDIVYNN